MEPKKKFELKPETLTTTAPRGTKILLPKQPFKLTGEIVQRKNTDMQTDIPKRRSLTDSGSSTLYTQEPKQKRKLTDSGSNEIFNIPSETRDYKSVLNAANKEMKALVQKVEKLSKKKETKPIETQTEPNIKSVSSVATETQAIPKQKKLIFNSKKIDKKKQLDKLKQFTPENLLVAPKRPALKSFVVQMGQPSMKVINKKIDSDASKEQLKDKSKAILAGSQPLSTFKRLDTMPTKHETYRYGINVKRKEKEEMKKNIKLLTNAADINSKHKYENAAEKLLKTKNMLNDAGRSDTNMNQILQGLQLKNKVPDFIKKDTGGILSKPQKAQKDILKSLSNVSDINVSSQKGSNNILKSSQSDKSMSNVLKGLEIANMKPVELFGGTRAGTDIHPEPTAPPQPLFGQNLKITMRNNYDEIKKLFDIEPKSYQEVLDAKKKINMYKQNIKRIKIRKNAKSILSDEEKALKKDVLDEIAKMQKTYDKVYKDFYKTQQPKRGRKAKA
jgi:hypothetical protein